MSEQETRVQKIRAKLDAVKAALRDNEVDVFNPAHRASWDDVEYLLELIAAREGLAALVEQWREHAEAIRNSDPWGDISPLVRARAQTYRKCADELAAWLAQEPGEK